MPYEVPEQWGYHVRGRPDGRPSFRPLDGRFWQLEEPLYYRSKLGIVFEVGKRFKCDGASIRILTPFIPWQSVIRSGFLHDALVRDPARHGLEHRYQADAIFYEALEHDGRGQMTRLLMWSGVHTWSWFRHGKRG